MKPAKSCTCNTIAFIFFIVIIICLSGNSHAFHDGGVAACEGCHTMHNSQSGTAMTTALPQFQSGAYLLRGTDQGSTCLNCHERAGSTGPSSFRVSTANSDMPIGAPPIQLSPGGDFGWLKKTYTWAGEAGQEASRGERHGHSIIAQDYGYTPDSTITAAPGGDAFQYPSNRLTCISCHDPHGKYRRNSDGTITTTGKPIKGSGSYNTSADPDSTTSVGVYRLLGGVGYQPKSLSGSYGFQFRPFFAVTPEDYNRSEAATDVRVAYGSNVSLWCANCHAQMHTTFGTVVHPADQAMGPTVNTYNVYVKTGDLTGTQATAYLSLVPFQMDNTTNMTTLKSAVTSTAGPTSGDRVMCLSCHRAHASGWDSMMRFPISTFMTVDGGGGAPIYPNPSANPVQAMGRTTQEFQMALYDRPATKFAPFQRALCNKCHARD